MTAVHPLSVIDPVCGMTVNVDHAEAAGLTVTQGDRIYAFCRSDCLRAFHEEPEAYAAKAADAGGSVTIAGSLVIDEGMRRWYESCSCCLSDAYPEVKAALDAERSAQASAHPEPGICQVAETNQEVVIR